MVNRPLPLRPTEAAPFLEHTRLFRLTLHFDTNSLYYPQLFLFTHAMFTLYPQGRL